MSMRIPKAVWVAAGVACVLTLAYAFYYHDRPRVDAKAYDAIAWNLASGNGYVEHFQNADRPEIDDAIVRVGPGYQFFLAGIYALVGHQVWVVWIIHALLRGLTVLLLALIALRLWPEQQRIAVMAAWLFALSPDLIVVSGLLLTETLFLFLLLGAVYVSLLAFEGGMHETFVAGSLWAFAILTRATALFGLFVFLGFLLYQRKFARAVLAVVCFVVIVGPWSYTMSKRFDAFIFTTTAGGYDLWVGNNPEATGGFVKTPEMQALREVTHSVELDRRGRVEYFKFMTSHPVDFVLLQFQKTAQYFSLARPTGFWVHLIAHPLQRLMTAGLSFVWTTIAMIGGVSAMWYVLRNGMSMPVAFVLGVAVVQPLAVIPIVVETRYRYALYPFLALFFGKSVVVRRELWKIIVAITILFIVVAGCDVAVHWGDLSNKANQLFSIF